MMQHCVVVYFLLVRRYRTGPRRLGLYRKRRYRIKKTIPRHVSRFRIKKRRFARRRLSRAVRHCRNNFSRVRRAKPTYIPASFGPVILILMIKQSLHGVRVMDFMTVSSRPLIWLVLRLLRIFLKAS